MIKIIPYFADFCICLAVSLKPDLFEGMRFDFTKGLNQKFFLTHRFLSSSCALMHSSEILTLLFVYLSRLFWPPISVFMGPTTIPSQSPETIKIPTANYEFGATFIDHPKVGSRHHDYLFKTSSESGGSIIFVFTVWGLIFQCLLAGRVMTDGRLSARVKYDLSDNFTMKANAQVKFCWFHFRSTLPNFFLLVCIEMCNWVVFSYLSSLQMSHICLMALSILITRSEHSSYMYMYIYILWHCSFFVFMIKLKNCNWIRLF